uniref:Uncharacterized protein n=1 Tax=Psilocybe cubensis TaxID=181762 RepID=A0A8H7Y4J9_PSICU
MADHQISSSDISWKDFMPGFFDDLFSCTSPEQLYDKYLGPSWRYNEDFWSVDACLQAGNNGGFNNTAFPIHHGSPLVMYSPSSSISITPYLSEGGEMVVPPLPICQGVVSPENLPRGDVHFPANHNYSHDSVYNWSTHFPRYTLCDTLNQPAFEDPNSLESTSLMYDSIQYHTIMLLVADQDSVSSDFPAPFGTQSFNESALNNFAFSSGSQNCQDVDYLTPSYTIGEGSNTYNNISISERQYSVDKSSRDLPVEHQQSKPDSHGRLCENSTDSQASRTVEQPVTEISSEKSQGHIPNCMKGFGISVTRERKQRRNDNRFVNLAGI